MAEVPLSFLVHTLTVKPYIGEGAYGPRYGNPISGIPCWIDSRRRIVRGPDGAEVLSEATITLRLEQQPNFLPGSLVTLHTEFFGAQFRESKVLSQAIRSDGGIGAWQHIEVTV